MAEDIAAMKAELEKLRAQIRGEAARKETALSELGAAIETAEKAGDWPTSISLKMRRLRLEAPENPVASSEVVAMAIGGLRPDGSVKPPGGDGSDEGTDEQT